MNKIFNVISWVFMPLTMPLIALLIVMNFETDIDFTNFWNSLYHLKPPIKRFFFNAFFLFGWVFPVLSLLILKLTKQIDSIELDNQKQRTTPLILTGLYSLMLLILLFKFNSEDIYLSRHLFSLAFSGVLMSILFLIINLKFKISLHAGGVGMLLGFLFSYYLDQSLIDMLPLYLACIVGGIVISARIGLKKHSNSELIVGFILGFIITFIVDYLSISL